ncbi:MAG: hypothetical protein AABX86_02925 [Nanoarchaeota archaeon]
MHYDPQKKEIFLDRSLNTLDEFVLKFITILARYVPYTIISGYVSIILGRARATEDIDLLIPKITFDLFKPLYEDLQQQGFWCLNAEDVQEVFSYFRDGYSVRFALRDTTIPNFEVKFPRTLGEKESFQDTIKIHLSQNDIVLCSLESHVAFKKYFLQSEKDIEDAAYVEELFKNQLDEHKINKYRQLIETNGK